jgi:hypothetical protein
MNNGDIINGSKLEEIITAHGGKCAVSEDGSFPAEFDSADELCLDGFDQFKIVLNYGYPVQFHLIGADYRAIITCGLTGRCDDLLGWVA